jgi:hypothetical protein
MHIISGISVLAIVATGLAILAVCLLLGWRVSRTNRTAGFARAARLFLPMWFLSAAVNMWYALTYGGHSFIQELPVFLLVFMVPAGAAMLIWWRVSLRLR